MSVEKPSDVKPHDAASSPQRCVVTRRADSPIIGFRATERTGALPVLGRTAAKSVRALCDASQLWHRLTRLPGFVGRQGLFTRLAPLCCHESAPGTAAPSLQQCMRAVPPLPLVACPTSERSHILLSNRDLLVNVPFCVLLTSYPLLVPRLRSAKVASPTRGVFGAGRARTTTRWSRSVRRASASGCFCRVRPRRRRAACGTQSTRGPRSSLGGKSTTARAEPRAFARA